MSNDAMLKRAKEVVVDYFNERVEKTDRKITEDDVFYKGLKMEWDKTTVCIRIGDYKRG